MFLKDIEQLIKINIKLIKELLSENMLEKIYYIKDNRLYFKYKRYKNKSINVKIPFKGEVYPILKYIHINNNHIGYKNMCNQILLSEFYWLGYSQDITNFLNK